MGGTTISTKAERINSVQLQQSSLGQPNPLIYGKTRVPTNLLWYGDFVAKAVTTTTESGKGGGVKQKNTTYEYYVAFQASFGHGVAVSVPTVWVGKQKFVGGATYSGTATSPPISLGSGSPVMSMATVVTSLSPITSSS